MDNYPWDVGRSETERTFLLQLERLCIGGGLFDAWTYYPQLVVTLSIDDPEHDVILRTLRINFDGQSLTGGNDPSHQVGCDEDWRRILNEIVPNREPKATVIETLRSGILSQRLV